MKVFLRKRSAPFTIKADTVDLQGSFLYCIDTSTDEAHPYSSRSPKQRRVVAMFLTQSVETVLYRDADDADV